MSATAINVNGISTALVPLFITNATTSNHLVNFRIENNLLQLPIRIKPGEQKHVFTGTIEQVQDIQNQLDRQGYVDLATAIEKGADVFYTVQYPTSTDKISQVVEKEQANSVQELNDLAETRVKSNKADGKQRLKSENSGLQSIEIKEEKV